MNPAALKANLERPQAGRHADPRTPRPFNDEEPRARRLHEQPARRRHARELPRLQGRHHRHDAASRSKSSKLNQRAAVRCKNFFALGLVYWLYNRDARAHASTWIEQGFGESPSRATRTCARSRPATTSARPPSCSSTATRCAQAKIEPGRYTQHLGQRGARRSGLLAAAELSGLAAVPRLAIRSRRPRTSCTPRAPQALGRDDVPGRRRDRRGVLRRSARAYAGALALTTTSGPGIALKAEAIGLAVMIELPLVIINVQRGGPEHGPADQDRAGRPAAGACTAATASRRCRSSPRARPGDCFYAAIEACRIAVKYMTPVMLLSDGYIANGAEPWRSRR